MPTQEDRFEWVDLMAEGYFLGIEGFSKGAAGIWVLVILALGAIIRQWITGLADRQRAENEGVTTLSGANKVVIDNLIAEVARLTNQVAMQDERISRQGMRITELEKRNSELERDLHESRLMTDAKSKDELSAIRASAQNDISTAKVLKGLKT